MVAVQDLFRSAREMQAAGDIDEAIGIYERILDQNPKFAAALHALGVAMNQREDYGRAVNLLERAVVLRPSNPIWQVDLGEAYRNLREFREGVTTGLALSSSPELPV